MLLSQSGSATGCVAESDERLAAIGRGPVDPHWKTELIHLASALSAQSQGARPCGIASLQALGKASVSNHQPGIIENAMAGQSFKKLHCLRAELF